MNANQVVEKILGEAKASVDKIKAETDAKLNALNAAGDQELAAYEQQTQQLCEKTAAESSERILAAARMAALRQETETKRALLNKVIEKTAEKIKAMSDAEYLDLMEGLLIASVKTGNEELIVGTHETRINEDFVRRVNQKLGEKGRLQLAGERANIEAGFILRQGKRRINASLDVMLKAAAQELEGKLSETLFG